MIGTTLLDRYRLDSELGRGGMGVVYRAHDTLLDRVVAVKVLSDSGLGTEGRARLLREAQSAAKLNHPNIVTVYDAGEADPLGLTPFIVMELVEGESLFHRKPQSLDGTLSIVRQLCAALEHAHSHGIIHRDLKPENILVAEDGTAKLMDFGLARSTASRLTTEGAIVGTVFYLAPEQALGQPFDGRADLYSLGVLLYELIADRLPFTADDALSVISQHIHASVVPPSTYNPSISPALDALIVRLLSKQPAGRPASVAEVREALDHLDAAPVSAEELLPLDRIVRGKMVAREKELAEASAIWRRAASGEGQVLLISGEPGIGKTRLVRELMALAEVSGARALLGECYAEGGMPYAPIAQMIRETILPLSHGERGSGGEGILADLLTLAPDLRTRFPDVPPNPPLDPQTEQNRIFESVVSALAALAEERPVLCVVDDAHWADSGTLALVRHLARRLRKSRVLIVATYREVELDESRTLNEVLHDLNRERLATRIKLTRFGREGTRDLLAAMFQEEITPEFLDGIYRETEGNPFFVEEVCKALIEEGKLRFEGGRWHRPAMTEMEIPQSLRVVIQARVEKLSSAAQETLRMAAILGREFDFDTLKNCNEQNEDALIAALEEATKAQLVAEVKRPGLRGETFAFAHALIPATLRESVSGLRRHRLHRRAAAAIEALRPDDYEALAHHHSQAGDEERARDFYEKAGRRALAVYANPEAERFYRAALEATPGGPDRARLLHGLGESLSRQGQYDETVKVWQEAITLYQAEGDVDNAARLYARSGRAAWHANDTPRALALCMQGLASLPNSPDSAGLAELFHETARSYYFNGQMAEAEPHCRRALETAERFGDLRVQADALITLSLLDLGSIEEQVAALRRGVEIAEAAGFLDTASRGHNNLALTLHHQFGDLPGARAQYERAIELARQMRVAEAEFFYTSGLSFVLLGQGEFAVAGEMLARMRQGQSRVTNPGLSRGLVAGVESVLQQMRGELETSLAGLRVEGQEMRRAGNLQFLSAITGLLGEVLLELGMERNAPGLLAEAEEALNEAIGVGDRFDPTNIAPRSSLAVVYAQQGRIEEARRLLADTRERFEKRKGALDEPIVRIAEAHLAIVEKRWPEAQAAFDSAAAIYARLNMPWHRAHAQIQRANAHLARNESGDAARARELLEEALAEYEAMDVPIYAAKMRERLESLTR